MRLKIFKLILFFIFCFNNSESNNYYQKLSDFFSFKNNDSDNDKFVIKKKFFNFLKITYGTVLSIYYLKASLKCNIDITKTFLNLISKVLPKNRITIENITREEIIILKEFLRERASEMRGDLESLYTALEKIP